MGAARPVVPLEVALGPLSPHVAALADAMRSDRCGWLPSVALTGVADADAGVSWRRTWAVLGPGPRPLGWVRLECDGPAAALTVYVVPGARRIGVGAAAVGAALEFAASVGLARVFAVCDPGNVAAVALLRSCAGFVEVLHPSDGWREFVAEARRVNRR